MLSPVRNLSDPGQNASGPQVAVEPGGDAVFAWSRFDGTETQVEARTRSAAGALRPFTTLSEPGGAAGPAVGVDADGDAVVGWSASPGSFLRIQTSAGP